MTKICTKCFCEKSLTEFYVRQTGKAEVSCKVCGREATLSWRKKNRARDRKNALNWWNKNRERGLATQKKRRTAYPERQRKCVAAWRAIKGEKQFRNTLADRLREHVRSALQGTAKAASTLTLLGCSVEELKAHLAKQFRPGMMWETYGLWQIDHIKPCAKFDLRDPSQQKQCFHFSNLQPLWALENFKKNDRYAGD